MARHQTAFANTETEPKPLTPAERDAAVARRTAREQEAATAQRDELTRRTGKNLTRTQAAKLAAKEEALKRAEADARRMPKEPALPPLTPGKSEPLHILNARARAANTAMRDVAADIGRAAGKAAMAAAQGRVPGHRSRQHKAALAENALQARQQGQTQG